MHGTVALGKTLQQPDETRVTRKTQGQTAGERTRDRRKGKAARRKSGEGTEEKVKTGEREEGDRGQGDGGGEQGRKMEENGGWGEVEKGGVVTQWRSKSNSAASKRTEAIGQEVFQHMSGTAMTKNSLFCKLQEEGVHVSGKRRVLNHVPAGVAHI